MRESGTLCCCAEAVPVGLAAHPALLQLDLAGNRLEQWVATSADIAAAPLTHISIAGNPLEVSPFLFVFSSTAGGEAGSCSQPAVLLMRAGGARVTAAARSAAQREARPPVTPAPRCLPCRAGRSLSLRA